MTESGIEPVASRCAPYLVLLVMAGSAMGCGDRIYTQEVRVISHRFPKLQIDANALPAGWQAVVEEHGDITTVNISPKLKTPVSEWDVPLKVVIEPITQARGLAEPRNRPTQRAGRAPAALSRNAAASSPVKDAPATQIVFSEAEWMSSMRSVFQPNMPVSALFAQIGPGTAGTHHSQLYQGPDGQTAVIQLDEQRETVIHAWLKAKNGVVEKLF